MANRDLGIWSIKPGMKPKEVVFNLSNAILNEVIGWDRWNERQRFIHKAKLVEGLVKRLSQQAHGFRHPKIHAPDKKTALKACRREGVRVQDCKFVIRKQNLQPNETNDECSGVARR